MCPLWDAEHADNHPVSLHRKPFKPRFQILFMRAEHFDWCEKYFSGVEFVPLQNIELALKQRLGQERMLGWLREVALRRALPARYVK